MISALLQLHIHVDLWYHAVSRLHYTVEETVGKCGAVSMDKWVLNLKAQHFQIPCEMSCFVIDSKPSRALSCLYQKRHTKRTNSSSSPYMITTSISLSVGRCLPFNCLLTQKWKLLAESSEVGFFDWLGYFAQCMNNSIFNQLLNFILCVWVFCLCVYLKTRHVPSAIPLEFRRVHQIIWNWSHGWLSHHMDVEERIKISVESNRCF